MVAIKSRNATKSTCKIRYFSGLSLISNLCFPKGVSVPTLRNLNNDLFLILFMTIEASRFLMSLHSVAGAAREANRVFAVRGDQDAAQQVALEYMQRSFFRIQDLDVTFATEPSNIEGFEVLSCEVEIDFEDVSLISDPFNLGVQEVRGFAAMYRSNN